MSNERSYTYRNGQKVELEKKPDQFVVRALPEDEVSVDISHTYIGGLLVSLVSPAGTTAPLHKRAGSWTDNNIITTYTPATKPALQTRRGRIASGRMAAKGSQSGWPG